MLVDCCFAIRFWFVYGLIVVLGWVFAVVYGLNDCGGLFGLVSVV